MSIEGETQEFLGYLRANESVRSLIKAKRDKTLIYAGRFFQAVFKELENDNKKNANLAELEMLSDVLELVPAPSGCAGRTLKEYVEGLLMRVPERPDGCAIWKALSDDLPGRARRGRVDPHVTGTVKALDVRETTNGSSGECLPNAPVGDGGRREPSREAKETCFPSGRMSELEALLNRQQYGFRQRSRAADQPAACPRLLGRHARVNKARRNEL